VITIFRKILKKIRKESKPKKYKNRFEKFYYLNKEHVSKYRKERYEEKKKNGICIKCKNKAIKGINFCAYHRKQTKKYNEKAKKG